MTDLNVRSDSVNVEQIMRQIRARIREKRGVDYTEAELQRLASAKFEQFADPSGLRSDLLDQFRKRGDEPSTYHRHRGLRRLLLMIAHPILKRVQKQLMSDLNLYFEIIHNLVVEVTRLGIEVHNLKMRVESLSSRLDFDERRAKALESVVQYRPGVQAGAGAAETGGITSTAGSTGPEQATRGEGERRRRRRRRRRRPGSTLADSPGAAAAGGSALPAPASALAADGPGGTTDDRVNEDVDEGDEDPEQ